MAPKTPIEKVAFPRVVESDIDKKMMPEALYAALDLGTNSCRMLIAQPKGAQFHVIDSFAKSVQLGSGLEKTGRLSRDSINRTIQALQVCKQKLDKYDVKFARLVATEACRRAKNSKEFISKVFQQTGLKLNIIDTEEEARLAVISCAPLVSRKSEQLLVVDIGGVQLNLSGSI
jgi:exopolyphosphatase/guanosine-5'-triphosphate,3'-diphosphate pyrophosphatase